MGRFGWMVLCMALVASPVAAKEKKVAEKPKAEWEQQHKLQKEKILEIKDSEWDVTLISGNGKDRKTEKDKLVFSGGRVSLKSFEKRFPAVGYTVTPKDDGTAKWENYQENDKGSLSILGDWDGNVMKGGVVETSVDGEKSTSTAYSFTSSRVPVAEKVEEPVVPAAEGAVEEEQLLDQELPKED